MTSLIRNERLKLTANWMNAFSIAVMTAGVLGPIAYFLFGLGTKPVNPIYIVEVALCCVVVSVGLHMIGRALLGELEHDA